MLRYHNKSKAIGNLMTIKVLCTFILTFFCSISLVEAQEVVKTESNVDLLSFNNEKGTFVVNLDNTEVARPKYLYLILSKELWEKSLQANRLILPTQKDPFIRLAKEEQIEPIIEKYWRGVENVILKIESENMLGSLVYETNPGGSNKYYHFYNGFIPFDAIVGSLAVNSHIASKRNIRADKITKFTHQQSTVRATIDFGSGAVKIQVANVDTESNRLIGEPLVAKFTPLGLTENVAANDGYISDKMQQRALEILRGFKDEAREAAALQKVAFVGIATAVFRKAENGKELLEKFEQELGINFQILPQNEEGKLGFLTAKALYPNVLEDNLLAWDSGNGSFQMVTKGDENLENYQGPLGHGTVRVMLSRDIREMPVLQSDQSGNPVFKDEAVELVYKIRKALPIIPDWLREKLSSKQTVIATFGGGESIFALVAQAIAAFDGSKELVQKAVITQAGIVKVIEAYIEKDDQAFDANGLHRKTLSSALHLGAVMDHLEIDTIHYSRSVGSTPGMLIAPYLWEKDNKQKFRVEHKSTNGEF